MKTLTFKLLAILTIAFIGLQFFGPDQSLPQTDPSKDFLTNTHPPADISSIIRNSCYDCHSYETQYPWYAGVEPLSWWLQDHIEEGREEFNMSLWTDYTAERADHKLEEAVEKVKEEEMPLPSYTWVHSEARLSKDQRTALANWFSSLRDNPSNNEHEDGDESH